MSQGNLGERKKMRKLFLFCTIIMLLQTSCVTATKVENYVYSELRSINEDEDEGGRLPHKKVGGEEVDKSKETREN